MDEPPPGVIMPHACASLALDALLTTLALGVAVALDLGLLVAPRGVDVLVSDAAHARLVVPDSALLASAARVAAFAGALPPLLILVVDSCARRSRADRTARRLLGYAAGAAVTVAACGAMRMAGGRAAPDFLAACAPAATTTRVVGGRGAECSRAVAVATLASFPSTPAALALYSTALCAFYVRAHVNLGDGVGPTLLQAGIVIGGLAAALAQRGDARAADVDVAAGLAIGAAAAALTQVRFFGGLARSFCGEDASELAEFLHAHHDAANRAAAAVLPPVEPPVVSGTATELPLPLRFLHQQHQK
jgi:hypothetical protein